MERGPWRMRLLFLFLLPSFAFAATPDSPALKYLLGAKYPSSEYEHSFNRDMLLDAEQKFENRDALLSQSEQTVDHYLNYLKWREMAATKSSGFPPARPIEETLHAIQQTEVYAALKSFPKGGNLHSHEDHQVSKSTLFDIVWASEDFQHLYMLPDNHPTDPWMMDFFITPPSNDWIKVSTSNYTKEQILKQNTLLGLMTANATRYPTESSLRWTLIGPLWGRCSVQLTSNLNIKTKYLQAMYEHGLSEGIIYYETRRNFGGELPIYILNSSSLYNSTNGKQFLGIGGDLEVEVAMEQASNFSKLHPEFVGHKRISYTYRQNTMADFKTDMDNVARLYKKYPQHVLGFDAVGEEDAGFSSLHYIQNYLSLYDSALGDSSTPLYLHTAETSWPDDLIASSVEGDIVSTIQNAYETLLLRAKRIGHGFGFQKHPYLLEFIRQRNIAIEICLVSNQILAFSPDLRNHAGQFYYRSGIPIVLSPDDPGTFGYDNLTVDWYQAFMGWGLNLGDLKQLALNSLNYSGMTDVEKQDAIHNKWTPMWVNYITAIMTQACARNYTLEAQSENRAVTFYRVLPRDGAISGTTKVHIFGRNFERAICKTPQCQFGSHGASTAVYISNQHIVCEAPDCGGCQENTVPVSISLDGGAFVNTGLNFTYKHPEMTTPTSAVGSASNVKPLYFLIVALLLIGIFKLRLFASSAYKY